MAGIYWGLNILSIVVSCIVGQTLFAPNEVPPGFWAVLVVFGFLELSVALWRATEFFPLQSVALIVTWSWLMILWHARVVGRASRLSLNPFWKYMNEVANFRGAYVAKGGMWSAGADDPDGFDLTGESSQDEFTEKKKAALAQLKEQQRSLSSTAENSIEMNPTQSGTAPLTGYGSTNGDEGLSTAADINRKIEQFILQETIPFHMYLIIYIIVVAVAVGLPFAVCKHQ